MIEIKSVRDAETQADDCVSRQAVIDLIEERYRNNDVVTLGAIKKLPSVNPSVSIQITEREKYGRFN